MSSHPLTLGDQRRLLKQHRSDSSGAFIDWLLFEFFFWSFFLCFLSVPIGFGIALSSMLFK